MIRSLCIILMVQFLGCDNKDRISIEIDSYRGRDSEPQSVANELEIFKKGDFYYYEYREPAMPDSMGTYLIIQEKDRIDSIIWFETMVPLVGLDTFTSSQKPVIIYKYEYDIVGGADEELEISFVPGHGVVFMKSLAWALFSTFTSNDIWSKELNRYILNDTSGFYFDPPIDFDSYPSIQEILEDEELKEVLEDSLNDSAAANI